MNPIPAIARDRKRLAALLLAVLSALAGLLYFGMRHLMPPEVPSVAVMPVEAPPGDTAPDHVFKWVITKGDSLSSIFDRFNISQAAMYQILAADEALLALDVLRPGNRLTLTLDRESRQLAELELWIHAGSRVVYRRTGEGGFDFEEVELPGRWEQQVLESEIHGSFFLSATRAGLTEAETESIADLFKDQLDFSREIRAGDRFQVVRQQQYVEHEHTGQSRIEGIRILRRNRVHSAFLFEDGNYYDQKGDSLVRAFMRYPTARRFRVSSAFSNVRRHPVTGRIAPHNGVDLAMPTGTDVLSTGDGVVTRVLNHPFAGRYIEIQHAGQYVTRYLHLHKQLVKRGQRVQRGQRIALSGNTGRSTGPHLHFELHVNRRPVDPLTARIPMASSVPAQKLALFKQRVDALVAMMGPVEERIASGNQAAAAADRI